MIEIREYLVSLGFVLTNNPPQVWSDHLYEWKYEPDRGTCYYVWIISGSNCYWHIEMQAKAMETGDHGFPKSVVFVGTTGNLDKFKTVLEVTSVLSTVRPR